MNHQVGYFTRLWLVEYMRSKLCHVSISIHSSVSHYGSDLRNSAKLSAHSCVDIKLLSHTTGLHLLGKVVCEIVQPGREPLRPSNSSSILTATLLLTYRL